MKKSKRLLKRKCLKFWSLRVRQAEGYRCQWCGKKSIRNHAHHFVPRSICNLYGLFDLRNGVTLCYRDHLYKIRDYPDEYIKFRESYLMEKYNITYEQLRAEFRNPVKMDIAAYEAKLNELQNL